MNEEVAYRVAQGEVEYIDRKFQPSDLDGVDMVLTAVDDSEASTQIWKLCKERKISANIADVPPECDFYFGSVHRDGPLQIMVSTNGNGPKLASIVRKQIAASLPKNIGAAIQNVGALRKKLRLVAPGIEEGPKRMQWCGYSNHGRFFFSIFFSLFWQIAYYLTHRMSKVCESWSLEDLVDLDEKDMDALLAFYKPGTVPKLEQLRDGKASNEYVFDGSFGWW